MTTTGIEADPLTQDADWLAVINNQIDPTNARELFLHAIHSLDKLISTHPAAEADARDLLRRRFEGAITVDTWPTVDEVLRKYFGSEITYLLTWVIIDSDQVNRMEQIEALAPPSVTRFINTMLAFFGPELDQAVSQFMSLPDDWRSFFRDVTFDQINNRFLIKIRLLKFNGNYVSIEGAPNSILNLARNLIWTLSTIASKDMFSSEIAQGFLDDLNQLLPVLTSEPTEASTAHAEATSSGP
jgi:hypothetical protein